MCRKERNENQNLLLRWKHPFWFWVTIDLSLIPSLILQQILLLPFTPPPPLFTLIPLFHPYAKPNATATNGAAAAATIGEMPALQPQSPNVPTSIPIQPSWTLQPQPLLLLLLEHRCTSRHRSSHWNFWRCRTLRAVCLYHPHQPQFPNTNLRIAKINLTTSVDSSSHLTTLLNLTLIAQNPNNHLVFFYERFTVTAFSDSIPIGNGSLSAFTRMLSRGWVGVDNCINGNDGYGVVVC
ncbi:NDR1/HIN1-like protein 13 [Senna tora]|uniref:NDR1/HIN1-like protein 13 n=1 Tax=Senna tora TaxID=362788 RepID=A0A834WSY5_9FABA|nr:NDR1/HIN1-like protein 13 [Senna tora]